MTGTKVAAGQEQAPKAGRRKESLPTTVDVGASPSVPAEPDTAPAQPLPGLGTRVGRYRLLEQLGRGGMGVVFVAHDPELDRRVAVKFLRPGENQARFVREARALAKLSHPNIVAVYDVGRFDDRTFIAMELIEGVTLGAWMDEHSGDMQQTLDVLLHAGRGLAAAHAAGLVHRDFKPDNVVLGRDGRVRVIDFGIVSASGTERLIASNAHAAGQSNAPESAADHLTAAGSLMGTPAYMSPEQLFAEPTDERADQFSFCVVAWEALYGCRPYPELRFARQLGADIAGPEVPQNAPVPQWLQRIIERGLALDKAERYPSMDDLLDAIEQGRAREASVATLVGGRYEPVPSTTEVSRALSAIDRLTGKLVTVRTIDLERELDVDSTRARVMLARAFRSLSALRHPNLTSVLDFGFDSSGAPYLVLDQTEPGVGLVTAARDDAGSALDYLVQLLRVLGYLHRHRVILGAVASEMSVVIEHQFKLAPLGFGVDAAARKSKCVAPEVAAGGEPSVPGDLYAFGLLALEVLSGHLEPSAVGERLRFDPNVLEVEPAAAPVLERLLRQDPEERYQSAEQVIAAFAEALSRPLALETPETRESRLRAAPLSGRDREVAALHAAVRRAVAGEGGAWLIGGESGVGKSRLVDEIGTLGLVHGALVVRGQEQSEGASPYRLFRDVLRWLALTVELDNLEAGVLLPLIPNLPRLLGRPVPVAPELDAPSMQARLLEVVERIFLRQEQPLVLLLEDLQWSQSDSMKMLEGVLHLAQSIPLLVVATYRDDESPQLPEQLSQVQTIRLERLDRPAIEELAIAMIGEAGGRSDIVDLLHRQTEGNAFFLVEVMRALVEEAGGVEGIGDLALPEKVFAGGIRRVVQRRLRRVPEPAQPLLRAAAIIGRQIDAQLLRACDPSVDLGSWLSQCVEAGVLERTGDDVRFAHDQLREGLLDSMDDDERTRLHGEVASAIERTYPEDPEQFAALAFHYERSKDAPKHAHYGALAGHVMMLHGGGPEAIVLLEQARRHLAQHGTPVERARVGTHLGHTYCQFADAPNALAVAAEAMHAVGAQCPSGTFARGVALIWQLWVHVLFRLFPGLARARSETRRAEKLAACKAAAVLVQASIHASDNTGVLLFSLMAYNLSVRAGEPDQVASGFIGFGLSSLGLHRIAATYFASDPDPSDWHGRTYAILKGSHLLGVGNIAAAEDMLQRDAKLCRSHGFRSALGYMEFLLGYCAYFRGQLDSAEGLLRRAVLEDTRLPFLHALALVQCLRGRALDALTNAVEATGLGVSTSPRAIGLGVLALLRVRGGDVPGALDAAAEATSVGVQIYTFGYAGAGYFMGLLEAHLADLERVLGGDDRSARDVDRRVVQLRRLLRQSRKWARGTRIGLAQTWLYEGKLDAMLGNETRARRAWHRSLKAAQEMDLCLFAASAHLELARIASTDDERRRHVEGARPALEQAGDEYVAQLDELLPLPANAGAPT